MAGAGMMSNGRNLPSFTTSRTLKGHVRARDRRKTTGPKKPCRRWQLVVEDGHDEAKRRQQRYRSFEGTKPEAERALRKFIEEVESGFVGAGDDLTTTAYFERWIEHCSTRVRPRSLTSYRQLWELHLSPHLGKKKLRDLRPMDVQELYAKLQRSGRRTKKGGALSANTVLHVHRVLSMALKQAVRWRLVSVNVADAVEPPRIQRTEMRTLDRAEVQKLLGAAKNSRLYEPILLAISTGMRRGEILGLKWSDIDLEKSRLRVARSLQPDRSLAEPKTVRSRREISLPATTVGAIRQLKVRQNKLKLKLGSGYADQGFVFANELGAAWVPDSISTLFQSIVRHAELGKLRFHDLRHTAASLLLEKGTPITTVAQILGHANTSTTLSVYAHAVKGSSQVAASVMEGILQGAAEVC